MEKIQEKLRLQAAKNNQMSWKKWGPYLSERQWGTVREDYSDNGAAWDYFTHDQSRSRAYRWGEDGIGGICDDQQLLCFSLALWNGTDPILKERLFGLTNSEGNHGEDVKEYYYYLDSTPTHSYMKYLYKYPQLAYPYDKLVTNNKNSNRYQLEYELLNTGIFDQNRYFDVFVEYAKNTPEDILISITIVNRGPEAAELQVLPTLLFRNTWSWVKGTHKPSLQQINIREGITGVIANHPELDTKYFYCEGDVPLLFTDNETNLERIFGQVNLNPYVKDGINNYVVNQQKEAINPHQIGTKVSAQYQLTIGAGQTKVIRLRLSNLGPETPQLFGQEFDQIKSDRLQECDEFYQSITPAQISSDAALVMRQALAGMLWSKQYYYFNLDQWLKDHNAHPESKHKSSFGRNKQWFYLNSNDIISMPDKWEYPWFAAWDLAFHTVVLALVDMDFAKEQLNLMLEEDYLHPNGQIPAYEWNFSDVNPPVHAWAVYQIYLREKGENGQGDLDFLKNSFNKLILNFTWWVNRKDAGDNNVFEGGFLGLDNIGVFDRSAPLPTGGYIEQADGTAWMAFYSQVMFIMALELGAHDQVYENMAIKFYEHFILIASAMDRIGDNKDELWDEHDGFFYDVLRLPNGESIRLKVRSMVGLLPLFTVNVISPENLEKLPKLRARINWLNKNRPYLGKNLSMFDRPGYKGNYLLSILDEKKLRLILAKLLDQKEFFSDYGIRALSRYHYENPYVFTIGRDIYKVAYEASESTSGLFGGNSNWRGPIWMPVNFLLVSSILALYPFYGDDFKVECPTGSGKYMTLWEIGEEIANRLVKIFLLNDQGQRPVYGDTVKCQKDLNWRDYLLFYEYFHGDNGAGIGASHQTGWTGLVAVLIQFLGVANSREGLESKGITSTLYNNNQ